MKVLEKEQLSSMKKAPPEEPDTKKPRRNKPLPKLNLDRVITMKGDEGIQKLFALFDNPPFRSVVLKIYPDVASIILRHFHGKNRSLARRALKRTNNALSKGVWSLTGDTIKFSKKNRLIDGQHRLTACVDNNMPIETHAVFNLLDKTFSVLDNGKSRNAGDALFIQGCGKYTEVASALKYIQLHDTGKIPRDWLNDDYLKVYQRIKQDATEDCDIDKCTFSNLVNKAYQWPPSMIRAMNYLIRREDPRVAEEFFNAWLYDNHIGRNEIFRTLHRRIIHTMKDGEANIKRDIRFALLILTFNIWHTWQEGDKTEFRRLTWNPKSDFPKLSIQKGLFE